MQDHPKHYCGVFAVYGAKPDQTANLVYRGLYALQHRGQESAGIVSTDGADFFHHKDMGLVSQVFNATALSKLKGTHALGHTRYSTAGSSTRVNAQPLCVKYKNGSLALAHNGNLTNAVSLRRSLEEGGSIFTTTTDSEIMLHLLAMADTDIIDAISSMMQKIQGAYSVAILTPDSLIALRDPSGFRPLSIGRLGEAFLISSETCAFTTVGATFVRDIEPGETVRISKVGLESFASPQTLKKSFCVFEYVYFARPDSLLSGRSVYVSRRLMGERLAKEYPITADIVVPIPDSGNIAAMGYSRATGIPYEMAFTRNHFAGRSFLNPVQSEREDVVDMKLNLIDDLVKDKRVILIDDSIVRGTTSQKRVLRLKEAGAREVHMLVSCPPHTHPCFYGIDFPDRSKLIAANLTREEIRTQLGLDSLGYLSEEGLLASVPDSGMCMACFTGNYPIKPETETQARENIFSI